MNFKYKKVVIIGVGLMGGSLGRTLYKNKISKEIVGIGRNIKKLKIAKEKKIITNFTTDIKTGVKNADIIVLCLPVKKIPEYFKKIKKYVSKNTAITDVGSVKEYIVNKIEKIDKNKNFVGSHPMVGSEKTGIDNIKDDLYKDGVCIITKTKNTDEKIFNKIKKFWKLVGMKVISLSPAMHDKYISGISHLPHLLSFLIVDLKRDIIKNKKEIIGKGFIDFTRIAASGEEIWAEIFMANKKNLLKDIDVYEKKLKRIKNLIQNGKETEIKKFIKKVRKIRGDLEK